MADEAKTWVDRKNFGERLKRLRKLNFLDDKASQGKFRKLIQIAYTQWQKVEEGASYIDYEALERWLRACGTTLSAFFADWEVEAGVAAKKELRIIQSQKELYQLLTEIIESEDSDRIRTIRMILRDAVIALNVEPEEVQQKPPPQTGNRYASRSR
jgi:hypothetical protein